MKKISLIIGIVILAAVSCKKGTFLDDKTSSLITEEGVFTDSIRTMAFLTRMYEEIGFAFNRYRWENGTTDQGTDLSEYTLSNPARRSVALGTGSYSAASFIFGDAWQLPWVNIRRANLLLQKLPETPLSPALKKRIEGEAKFMRAYFYAYMLVNFGGVPLIGDKVFGITDNINLPRNSFEECVNYVTKELDEAAALLPTPMDYQDIDFGRVTKGACMSIKARLLLYAASPLFNGGAIGVATPEQKKLAGYPDYNVNRWQTAAEAANAVINSGYYSLYVDNATAPGYGYYKVFLLRRNPEYILFVNRPPNKDFEVHSNPPSRGGQKHLQPSQNLVDFYPMKNGLPITDPASGFDPAKPYTNRDPRFDYSIIYNGSLYFSNTANKRDTVWTYEGAGATSDAFPNTWTGYYSRKMCDADISANSSPNTERGWPLLRYAEILLSYAEAINETGQPQLAYPKLIELRSRAGITPGTGGLYGLKPNMTVAEMREVIRNERTIELVYENDTRWDDIRRWKIAEVINNSGSPKCMHIKRIGSTFPRVYTYTVEQSGRPNSVHSFRPEMYLWPIPTDEIRKMPSLIQNPGW